MFHRYLIIRSLSVHYILCVLRRQYIKYPYLSFLISQKTQQLNWIKTSQPTHNTGGKDADYFFFRISFNF